MSVTQAGDTLVISPMGVPNDASPVARAAAILGGYVAVVDTSERDLIPASSRKQGMLARTNDGSFYTLGAGLTNSDWSLTSVGGAGSLLPVDAVITGTVAHSGTASQDGVTMTAGVSRVLDVGNSDATKRGIFVVQAGAWTAPSDYNSDAQVIVGQTVFVKSGTHAGLYWTLYSGSTIAGAKVFIPGKNPVRINLGEAPWRFPLDGSDQTAARDTLIAFCATLSASGGCYIEIPGGTLAFTTPLVLPQYCSIIGAGHFASVITTIDPTGTTPPCDTIYGYAPLNVGQPGFLVISNVKVQSAWTKTAANTWAPGSTHAADGATSLVAGHYYFPSRYSPKMLKLVSTTGATGAHPPLGELTPLNTPAMKLVGVPNAAAQVRVKIIAGGALGVMTFQVSTAVGAASYGSTQTTTAGDTFTYIIPGFGGTYGILISNFPGGYTAAAVVSPTPRVVVLGTPPDDDYVVDINPSMIGALGTAAFGLGYGINTEKWETGNVVSTVSTQTSSAGASWDYAIPATSLTIRFYAGDYTNPGNTWKYFSPAFQWSMQEARPRNSVGQFGTSDTNLQITDGNCVWEVAYGPSCIRLDGMGNLTLRDIDLEGGSMGLTRSQAEGVTISGSCRANNQWFCADWLTNGDGRFGEYGQFTNQNHTGGTFTIFSLGWGVIDDGGIGYTLDGATNFQRADGGFMFMAGRIGGAWIGSYVEGGRGFIRDCSYASRCPVGKVSGYFWGGNTWGSVVSSTHTVDCSSGMVGCSFKGNVFGGSLYGLKGWGATIDCDASGNAHTTNQPIVDAQPFSGHVLSNQIDTLVAAVCRGAAGSIVLANGNNNDIALPLRGTALATGPTGSFAITGMVAAGDGQEILIRCKLAQQWTVPHQSASSSAANRFVCPGAADIVMAAAPSGGFNYLAAVYNLADARWYVVGHS